MEVIPPGRPQSALRATDIERVVMTTTVDKVLNWAASTHCGRSVRPRVLRVEMIAMVAALRHPALRPRSCAPSPSERPLDRLRARVAPHDGPIRELGRCSSRSGSWRWAPARRQAACSPTTRSCRASTDRSGRRLRPRLPAPARGRDRGRHDDPERSGRHPAAYEQQRSQARARADAPRAGGGLGETVSRPTAR
jgi:hypothetical protein